MRINVIGTSGSGKTTFGRQLAETLQIPFVEMDALFWGPNWTFPQDDELFTTLSNALARDSWVLDGNYTRSIPIKWERVHVVIWLDFSFPITVYQASTRALTRLLRQDELWPGTGNRETLRMLFSRDSIVLWTIQTYSRNRKKNIEYFQNQEYKHIHFIQLTSPSHARSFLEKLEINPGILKKVEPGQENVYG